MLIKKIINITPNDFLKNNFELLNKTQTMVQNLINDVKLINFGSDVYIEDGFYRFHNQEEFVNSIPVFTKFMTDMLVNFSFRAPQEAWGNEIEFDFQYSKTSNRFYFSISNRTGKWNSKLNEFLLELLTIFPGKKYLSYDPISESRQKKEAIRFTCKYVLTDFDKYQIRSNQAIKNEKELQRYMYPILRSHFEDLEDEFQLPKFGGSSYIPDFGIPSAGLIIEAKYLRKKTDLKKIQKEIHDDIIGYLEPSNKYNQILVFIYNSNNIAIPEKYPKDLKKIRGIFDVIFTQGVIPTRR